MGKQRISVFLDTEQIETLKLLSRLTRIKQADYIREGLEMVFAKYQKELKKAPKKKGGE
jgi:hypothetical protein